MTTWANTSKSLATWANTSKSLKYSALLMESLDVILMESGDKLILESAGGAIQWSNINKS